MSNIIFAFQKAHNCCKAFCSKLYAVSNCSTKSFRIIDSRQIFVKKVTQKSLSVINASHLSSFRFQHLYRAHPYVPGTSLVKKINSVEVSRSFSNTDQNERTVRIYTIPNAICFLRIVASPFIGLLIVDGKFEFGLFCFVVAGISDG